MYCFLNFHLVRLPLYLWVQSLNCVPLCKPLDCSPPCSCIHGIFQARILEWVAISFPRRSSWPKDWTQFSCISFTGSQITTEPPCSSSCSVTSHVQLFATPWIAAHQTSLSFTISCSCSNSCSSSQWCHPTISSSVTASTPAFSLSQHQGLFQWVNSVHQVAKVLELLLQHQSFQMNIQGWFPLGLTGLILLSGGLSSVFSNNTTVQKHQFFSTQPFLWSNSHICKRVLEKP